MDRIAHPIRSRVALVACVVAILAGSLVFADEDSVTLSGEIEVAEYNSEGEIASVMIYDSEWGSVLISKAGRGKELFKHVGAMAKVTGTIVELEDDIDFAYSITVTSYSIEDPTEPEDDPDPDPESGK